MSDFEGLVAAVTGGASGLGKAVAEELQRRGARVYCLDLAPDGVDAPLTGIRCDISDDASVRDAIGAVVADAGRLDVVVANAGIGAQGDIESNDDDEWLRVLNVNVVGSARTVRHAMPHLRESPSAAVVFTSSVAASIGLPQRVLYSASKGAISAMTLAIATDCLPLGIRVNAVAPGTADTPWVGRLLDSAADPDAERAALEARQPSGRLVAPAEVADAVAYLASPRSGSTNGVILAVDGGMESLRPRR
ncbi:NAD(P)-dependent dehydrogenase (short-subunit alcohol dehydrogenase family) [Diaminobutyricimonas aerilata]|uniref:NAD(P)-dependent dehydrogenase (Short-subunit alcohol dehydrogenase family) n=1 Tax=Diaminobutyricimonas aerilata TaxID=1162967 RepID=A0A2M9CN66_9MICO|nr:SDR family oxidoreductase [Diaminobutyricimonas aerilata]PJJ73335.1 NAD(P)-dependent dehydrogenase (short-subunit alcohol dehydrogenase family) [Diaminobutyricimonas aerilata]